MNKLAYVVIAALMTVPAQAGWRIVSSHDQRQNLPKDFPSDGQEVRVGDKWNNDKFHWLIGDLEIPETIDGQDTAGKVVGMQFNCGDGGEVWLNGDIQGRFDNDHPLLFVVSEKATPGAKVQIVAQIYSRVQGGDNFDEAKWVIIDAQRALKPLKIEVDTSKALDAVPNGLIGLSQGAGLADYEDETAAKLREGGFKWFRMDNILTQVVKGEGDQLTYHWEDFDKRVDFIVGKMGADAIFAVSYMPQPLDAIPNHDRQSAPRDYKLWEDLCYRAAKRCVERGKPVKFWEVWNEANCGWIKPGPQDTGSPEFQALYDKALGKPCKDHGTVRTFEAYCKLYAASARGVLRGDPNAKIGGPALASGPFESDKYDFSRNGKGFARGLMLWCQQEKLPLDFVSWHEYFQPANIYAEEKETFVEYLQDFPQFQKSVQSFMITEWSEAWWHNRPQDHELGAAYCADTVIRAFIPKKIDRPCFFYVKQNDMNFRGDWSMIMERNTPKPMYNMAKIFNNLSGEYVAVEGTDDEVCAVAAWDAKAKRLAIVLVNFKYRHPVRRNVAVNLAKLPKELNGGTWREWTIDATHSNIWHNRDNREAAELTQTGQGKLAGKLDYQQQMQANSVILLELLGADAKK